MKRTLRCLEDCDRQTQIDYVSSLDKENLEKLVLSLSATLREIGDKHGIVRLNINYVLSKKSANEKDAIIGVISKTYRSIQSSLDKISDVMKSDLVAEVIVDLVCAEFSTDKEAVYSERRHKQLNEARTLIMYILRVELDWKFQDIGYKFNRDYSSVIAGVKRAKDWLEYDKVFIQKYNNVKKNMQNT